jgi:outer membrane protein
MLHVFGVDEERRGWARALWVAIPLCALTWSLEGRAQDVAPAPRVVHLDEAVRTGLEHQPSVLGARAQTEAAAGRVEQARAGYLPQVTGTALAQRVHGSASVRTTQNALPTTVGAAGQTYNVFSFGVSASQLIWDFGQTIDRTRAAAAQREAQESNERTARFAAALGIRQAFFQAHAQRALVAVGQESVTNMERHLEQVRGFVEQGIRPEIDLLQARTDLANARVTLINAQNGYLTAKAQLNQVMGVVQDTDYEVADEGLAPIPGEDGSGDALVKQALSARPEIASLEKQTKALELTVSSIRGAYGPTLSGIGGVSEAGPALDALGLNWNIGLSLNWPIFQGGLTRGEVREARANVSAAQAELTQATLDVRFQVEQARLNLRSAKAAIVAAKDARDNAKERLRLAEGRYESGVGSIIELDDAAVAALAAGAQLVQAEYNLSAARAGLLSALGR